MSVFITFEGGEGSGKSTQARVLYRRLLKSGIPALLTHEPGGTPLGTQLRRRLKGEGEIDPQTELLLFNASRAHLVSQVIRPALKEGTVVICDRFAASTTVYQGYGRGLDFDLIEAANNIATQGLRPDLTVLLDIPVEQGLARKSLRDRFEREEVAFHRRVRQGYLEMAKKDPERWLVLDASLPKKEVTRIIWERVEQILPNG
ncbi:MAG: dTMP kinase [Dehalococcoidia bacterium]|nr:dTMP kinase [Chloroflexota bacterium]MCK4242996.1 dTMP kinase [Dehalococcoidia bacterium]